MIADSTRRAGPRLIHLKGSRYSYLVTAPSTEDCRLDSTQCLGYTSPVKSESFPIVAKAAYSVLEPLLFDRSVVLLMELPPEGGKRKKAHERPIPVVIVPGPLFGTCPGRFLVSVVGKGSAVVAPMLDVRLANLVLAGMPKRFAHALMDEFRRVFSRR